MTLIHVPFNAPHHYACLSTDIVDNKVAGANYTGALLYVVDTGVWYIVNNDLTLSVFSNPSGTFAIDQSSPGNTNAVIVTNSSGEGAVNVSDASLLQIISGSTTIIHGQNTVAVAGTEEALAGSTTLKSGVRIKALHTNTNMVYVGLNPVTSATGFILDAGEEVFIEIDDPSKIYIDVDTAGEGVSYIGS